MTCEYCGRQLLKGEKCSCSGAVKARQKGKNSNTSYESSYDGYGSFTSFDNIGKTPDIDLTASGYRGSNSSQYTENDNLCNHNGTYFHQQTGWINANSGNSSNPNQSSYVYADYPKKTKRTNTLVAVVITIIIISFVIPVIAMLAFISNDSSSSHNTNEWDYDYDFDYDDYYYDNKEGFIHNDDDYTSTTDYKYETGSIEDNYYTNYWANIAFDIPKRYEVGTDSEYKEYSSETEDCAFLAFKDDGFGYIVVTTSDSPIYKLYSTDELIGSLSDNIIESFDESEMNYEITDTYDREIAGENWLCFDVNLIEFGYMSVAFHRIDHSIIYIIIYDNTKGRTDSFLDSITYIE